MIIGSGAWGQKVKSSLQSTKAEVSLIGARDIFNTELISVVKLIENKDLVWICTSPEMQLKILNLLKSLTNTKIVIEKPIGANLKINQEIFEIFSNQDNLHISRPWNFSELWLKFKENIIKGQGIKSILIEHSGEILREYINPPQDWLHHDLCLIHELNNDLKLSFSPSKKLWSNENKSLTINSRNGLNIEIVGGYSPERISIFDVFFENGTRIKMDMNNRELSIQASNATTETFKYRDDLPINSMVDHYIKTESNIVSKNHELKMLQELQILAI